MLNFAQLENLLVETSTLLEELSQLEETAENMKRISGSISRACQRLSPENNDVSKDLERLSRLHEVIQTYVYAHASQEGVNLNGEFGIGFEKSNSETGKTGGKMSGVAKAGLETTDVKRTAGYELLS